MTRKEVEKLSTLQDSGRLTLLGTGVHAEAIPRASYINNEPEFRWALFQDAMAFDKLHEGIKKFAEDGNALKYVLKEKLQAA